MEMSEESIGALWKLKHMTFRTLKRGYLPREEDYQVLLRKSTIFLLMCLVYDHTLKARRTNFFKLAAPASLETIQPTETTIDVHDSDPNIFFLGGYVSKSISSKSRE